jgi:hypothetical protein
MAKRATKFQPLTQRERYVANDKTWRAVWLAAHGEGVRYPNATKADFEMVVARAGVPPWTEGEAKVAARRLAKAVGRPSSPLINTALPPLTKLEAILRSGRRK